jgi:hypothetical protein
MTMLRNALIAASFVASVAVGTAIGVAVADQPHMHNALDDLRAARHQLDVAEADKGGHRVTAIGLVDQAITEVQAGIDYDRHH